MKFEEGTHTHIGNGKFKTMEGGQLYNLGPQASGMIRFVYFEDYSLPPVGWSVSREKLIRDYTAKLSQPGVLDKIILEK